MTELGVVAIAAASAVCWLPVMRAVARAIDRRTAARVAARETAPVASEVAQLTARLAALESELMALRTATSAALGAGAVRHTPAGGASAARGLELSTRAEPPCPAS